MSPLLLAPGSVHEEPLSDVHSVAIQIAGIQPSIRSVSKYAIEAYCHSLSCAFTVSGLIIVETLNINTIEKA